MCCGAGKRAGKLPANSYLLGDETPSPARFVRVLDPTILPVKSGTVYVRGSGVEQAIEDGLIEDASVKRVKQGPTRTEFHVTQPNGEVEEFATYQQARVFSTREGGTIKVVKIPLTPEE